MASILENISRKAIIEVIILVVALVGTLFITYVFIQTYLATDTPQVVVTTGSMTPTYLGYEDWASGGTYVFQGDLLIVKNVPLENVQVGDTIIFDSPSGPIPIVHRVVKINESNGIYYFWTKGDNPQTNRNLDSWAGRITGDQLHGVVIFRIPHVGWIIMQFQTVVLKILLIVAAIILLVFSLFGEEEEEEKPTQLPKLALWFQQKLDSIGKGHLFKFFQRSKNTYLLLFGFSLLIIFAISNLVMGFGVCNTEIVGFQDNINFAPNQYQAAGNEYFMPLRIKTTSYGFFNSAQKVEISVNGTIVYRWTVTYTYHGYKEIGAGIWIPWTSGQNNTVLFIDVSTYAVGLFPNIHTNTYEMYINFS
ncbi:MAG: signal peptidase I [Promethearchaeota archaeon]